jgi:D-sedoheptulose 7-phosphate isomerase
MKEYITQYIQQQKAALESIPIEQVETLLRIFQNALRDDRSIFVFGNGGSGTNASHFVTDLGKSASDKTFRRFRCLSLSDNVSWITAIGNDYAYEDVFLRQLENYARPGDVVLVMSVSGSSPNLVKAVEWCRKNDVQSIALIGGQKGKLAALADEVVVIDDVHYGRVEDCHMHICHIICYAFIEVEALQQP